MRFTRLALALPLFALACSATARSQFSATSGGATGGAAASGSGSGGAGPGGENVGGGIHLGAGGAGSGGGSAAVAEVFAQSSDVLYKLDPLTKKVTTIGPFNGCGGVIDIAIDKDGAMFAAASGGLYKIDKASAACSFIADGGYPNSLSFVPKGTVDPAAEALVGYQGSAYVRIDTKTGAITQLGDLGGGYASSGDIVSVIGGGTYLTVNGNSCGDCIVEVDPKTGKLKKMIGALGHGSVFGLAFWGGAAYGFDDAGELFQIDLTNGKSTTIPMPNPPSGLSFWGAGSTTAAPLVPPS